MSELLLESVVQNLAETNRTSGEIYRKFLAPHRNCLLLLEGELGAGKTAFVHALGPVLGITANINSPTFNLLNVYENPRRNSSACDLYHYDLYRISDPGELEDLDFVERWNETPHDDAPARLHAIEWWQRAGTALPETAIRFRLVLELLDAPAQMIDATAATGAANLQIDQDEEDPRILKLYRL